MQDDKLSNHIYHSERFVRALAARYGFKSRDFSLIWDGGEFQPARNEHDLTIIAADGRRSAAQIEHSALVSQNPWGYIRHVDAALMQLARREEVRGV